MVTPVWELAPENLSHIFLLYFSGHMDWVEIKRSSLKRSITLAQVNQHWRNIALLTPQIWTTIYIDKKAFLKMDNDLEEMCMPKVFLHWSGLCPLSLSVYSSKYNDAILATLLPLAECWHRITVDIPLLMLSALSPIYNCLPLLRMLEIKDTHVTRLRGIHLRFFSKAPLLHHLISSCQYLNSFDILPLHQLTRWGGPIAAMDMPKMFALAPNLEECFLQPLRLIPSTTFPENPAAHNLTSLHISTEVISSINFQLQLLPQFPCLCHLFIYFNKQVIFSGASILPLFVKSGGQLKYHMWGCTALVMTIIDCLKHTP